jgi:protein SCO1/2
MTPSSNNAIDRRPIFALLLVALAFVALGMWLLRERESLVDATLEDSIDEHEEGSFLGWAQDPPWPAPSLSLSDHRGDRFTIEDSRGQRLLIFFGFTHCPDVCPLTLSKLAASLEAYEDLAPENDSSAPKSPAQVIFVSVDPDRDTPEAISDYLSRFDMPVTGLTGELAELDEIVAEWGVVYYKEYPEGVDPESAEAAQNYSVVHSGTVFLIDELGMVRVTYRDPFLPEDIAIDLRVLDEEALR